MPFGWVAGATLIGAAIQADSAGDAADAQANSAGQGIDESRRQFDEVIRLMSPFVEGAAGEDGQGGSLQAMLDLVGLGGEDAQAGAISAIERSPQFSALLKQGEEGILQNASATGGLRGGNTQEALGEFRPALLSSLINDQYSRLSGITQIGQAAAAGQASAGLQTGAQVSNLLGQQGAAQAGASIAQGQAYGNAFSNFGQLAMLGKMKVF